MFTFILAVLLGLHVDEVDDDDAPDADLYGGDDPRSPEDLYQRRALRVPGGDPSGGRGAYLIDGIPAGRDLMRSGDPLFPDDDPHSSLYLLFHVEIDVGLRCVQNLYP